MGYAVLRHFQQISVISWRWVLLPKETGVPGENHRPVASHYLYYRKNVVLTNFYWLDVRFKVGGSRFFMILFAYSHDTMHVLQEVIYDPIKICSIYIYCPVDIIPICTSSFWHVWNINIKDNNCNLVHQR